jgi:hypothetical protein
MVGVESRVFSMLRTLLEYVQETHEERRLLIICSFDRETGPKLVDSMKLRHCIAVCLHASASLRIDFSSLLAACFTGP